MQVIFAAFLHQFLAKIFYVIINKIKAVETIGLIAPKVLRNGTFAYNPVFIGNKIQKQVVFFCR